MDGMFASAVQFGEQTSDFSPLWPRLPASDKRHAYDLLDGFATSALSSSKTMLFSTRGGVAILPEPRREPNSLAK
jgi:hypothetical protein